MFKVVMEASPTVGYVYLTGLSRKLVVKLGNP